MDERDETRDPIRRRGLLPWLAAFLTLHAFASLRPPWEETPFAEAYLRLSPDLVALLALGALLALALRSRVLPALLVTGALLLLPVFRAAAAAMPAFYGKPLDFYHDSPMLPSLVHLLFLHHGLAGRIGLTALALAILVVAAFAVYRLTALLLRPAAEKPAGKLGAGTGTLLFAAGILAAGPNFLVPRGISQASLLRRLVRTTSNSLHSWRDHESYTEGLPVARDRMAALPQDLEGLEGADVILVFIESYGRLLFRDPTTRAGLETLTGELTGQLASAGFHVCSSFASSAVVGGNSSLAHAQLLSGTRVASKRHLASLLASDLRPLPHVFDAAGYRTVNAQPATTEEWPEGKFFGFQEDRFYDSFGYEGHTYHWGFMPDQFALAKLLQDPIGSSDRPVFLQYVSVTSHAPFSMIPPYYEDWSEALEPGAFDRAPERTYPIDWLHYAGHPDVEAAYVDAIHYSLRTVVGFTVRLERPSLVVVLGDHQPPAVGELSKHDPSHDVPVHVFSNRIALLERFGRAGFQEGFLPDPATVAFDLSAFAESFLRAFSTGAGGGAGEGAGR